MKDKCIARDEPTYKFLSRLKELRTKAGLTLEVTADLLQIPCVTYRHYEYLEHWPSLSRLFKLAEFFDYDLSESINYKRYHGGLLQIELSGDTKDDKYISLDDCTRNFLNSLKFERKKIALTLKEAAYLLGCRMATLANYEHLRCYPMLRMLIKLSELYNYDISESVNYKYFHDEIDSFTLRQSLQHYGLGMRELSRLTRYSETSINMAIYFHNEMSLGCLSAIMEILKQEKKHYAYRQKLLTASRYEEYKRNRRRKHNA